MVGGLLALFEWEKTNRFRYLAWAWIFLSAATLTKGPIGLVIPVGIFGFWSLVTRGISLRTVVTLIGQCALVGAPVLLAASSWYIAAYMLRGPDFLDKVLEENVRRFAGTMEDEPHKHSFLFLLGTYVVGFAPWSIPWLVELWRRKQSLRSVPSAVTGWWLRQDRFLQFCALAVVVITLFFCLPDSKRSVYLLPAYPFVAVMLAGVIEAGGQISRKIARSFEVVTVVVAAGVCGVGFLWVAADASGIPLFSAYSSLIGALPPWRLVVVLALCGAWWLVLKRALPVGIETGLARSIVTVAVVTNLFVIGPVSEGLSPKGKLDAAPIAATIAQADGQPLLSFGTAQYAASFYLRRPFRRFVCSDQSGLVFVERRSMDDLEQLRGAAVRELAHIPTLLERQNREIVLVEAAPRVDGAGERRCIR
jgi:4-amino-4-deoxy-L-arabinose transferase-like glycosyltransferase